MGVYNDTQSVSFPVGRNVSHSNPPLKKEQMNRGKKRREGIETKKKNISEGKVKLTEYFRKDISQGEI